MKKLLLILLLFPTLLFAETKTYVCNYTTYSDQDGNHKVGNDFILSYIVDTKNGMSYLIGNNGSTEVTKIETSDKISFIEITGIGNITTTTIDVKLNSVHSRNMVLYGELIPSQYYGTCKIK